VHAALERLDRAGGGVHVGGLRVVHVEHAAHHAHLLEPVRHSGEAPQRTRHRVGERARGERRGRHLLDDAAAVHDREALAHVRDHREIVGHEQVGEAARGAQLGEQVQDLRLDRHIERAGRLVEQQHRGLLRQCAGDGDPLGFAARQVVHVAAGQRIEVEVGEDLADDVEVTSGPAAQERQVGGAAEQHVVGHLHARRDHRVLGDHGDAACALAVAYASRVGTDHLDVATGGHAAGQGPQQGRLAGAVGADHRHPLAGVDVEVEPVQDHGVPIGHGCAAGAQGGRSGRRGGGHVSRLDVRSTTAKNGAPKNAVTTPIGSSAGAISVRASRSANTRKAAPPRIDSGMTMR
jgi:hypothetical protein